MDKTLRNIRNMKGLNQSEASEILGISLRSYQTYETDPQKKGTFRYNQFCTLLLEYGKGTGSPSPEERVSTYYTSIVTGDGIQALFHKVRNYKKRDCYTSLKRFIDGDYDGKICVLYGLRRTGKTTMLFQMLGELPQDKAAYIKVKVTDNMSYLTKDLEKLYKNGFRYVFIDEITLLEDFINTAAVLPDIYGCMGMKIVVSGTDSLGFAMAERDELYDRSIMIHTSFIPYYEYERLLGICSVDRYIEYGGTLKIENMDFDDPESAFDDVSFRDDESTRKYIDSAISKNIQHTLKNNRYGEYFSELKKLYDEGELTNVINRIVENMNHEFVLKVVEEKFRSNDFGSAKDLMLHEAPAEKAYILYDVDREKIVERLKRIADIKEKEDLKVEVKQEHIDKVRKYLIMLDLVVNCQDMNESGKRQDHYIFTQPGMRYSIAKALVYSLRQDEYFRGVSESDRNAVVNKILEDVKGRMLEEIVMLETNKALPRNKTAFKYKFDDGSEFDMLIYDSENDTCEIFEVKHSSEINKNQYRHLIDEENLKKTEQRFGRITDRSVIYRGNSASLDNAIKYVNAENYLKNLYKDL